MLNETISVYKYEKSTHRRDLSNRIHEVANVNETVSTYASRRNSTNSAISNANSEPIEIAAHHVK